MQSIVEKNLLIERVHLLIKRRSTGSPDQLARKLGISKASTFRLLDTMKELEAPIIYNFNKGSYEYQYDVEFQFGFKKLHELKNEETINLGGGYNFFYTFSVQSHKVRLDIFNFRINT